MPQPISYVAHVCQDGQDSDGMERLREWLTPKEHVLPSLTPSTALSRWLTGDSGSRETPTEAPYLLSGAWGLSLLSHVRALIWNEGLMQKGYEQYRDGMFKLPLFGEWTTIANGKYVDEIAQASDSHLSFQATFNKQFQLQHLIGPEISEGHIHLPLIRTLTRNLSILYPEIADESEFVLTGVLGKGKQEDGWVSVKAFNFVTEVVTSLNQRAFVGLPLCRNEEWKKASGKDNMLFLLRAVLLRCFSESRRADANEYLCRFAGATSATEVIVAQLIKERLAIPGEDRPNDLITWILSRVDGENPTPKLVSGTLMLLNVVAQETTPMTLTHALYWLVSRPECIVTLREEILEATVDGELVYESLERMRKLDSFIRESQRVTSIDGVTLGRTAVQDFSFSNGMRVPAGGRIATALSPVHHDPENYPNPSEFRPWRFYDLARAEKAGSETRRNTTKYDSVTPSKTYLAWGLGKHACPGRWYAVMVMKHLLAYILLNYDFKLPDSAKGQRPEDFILASSHAPNMSARLLFRPRDSQHGA